MVMVVLHVRPDNGLIEKGPKYVACLLTLNKVLLCFDFPHYIIVIL